MKDQKLNSKDIINSYEHLSNYILQQKGRRILAVSAIGGALLLGTTTQSGLQAQTHFQEPIEYPDGISLDPDIGFIKPEYHDVDGDGDYDLIGTSGEYSDTTYTNDILYFPNIGTNNQPEFGEAKITSIDTGTSELYTFGDIDNDGDVDALAPFSSIDTVTYEIERNIYFLENQSRDSLDFADPVLNPFGLEKYTSPNHLVIPHLIDFDSDGDLDIVTTEVYIGFFYPSDYEVIFIENSGSADLPSFEDPSLILDNPDYLESLLISTVGDVDRDGDIDILGVGYDYTTYETNYIFLENTFDDGMPTFPRAVKDTFNLMTVDDEVAFPALLDYDNDGDLDLISSMEYEPRINLYLNSDLSDTRHISLHDLGVEIYPNPTSEVLYLKLPQNIVGNVHIVNTEGKVVYHQDITNPQLQIPVKNLPSGTYFIKLIGDHIEGYDQFIKD